MSETDTPVIGRPSAPVQAVVVALSDPFADAVLAARRRRLAVNGVALLAALALASAAVVVCGRYAWNLRGAAFLCVLGFGVLLSVGAFLRPRALELGRGIAARGEDGRVRPVQCARGVLLLVALSVHELFEGFVYGTRLRRDPAQDLAAWILLALAPPHGPGEGEWVSLEGVGAAGLFSLPEDLKPALRALRSRGWVSVDRGRYPPLVCLSAGGLSFVEGLLSGD